MSRPARDRRWWRRGTVAAALLVALVPAAAFAQWSATSSQSSKARSATLAAPGSFAAAQASSTSVTLSWTAPTPAPTSYVVVRTAGGGTVTGTCASPGTATSCTDSSLTTGTQYTWTVKAVRASWQSTTATVSFTPTATLKLHISAITETHAIKNSQKWNATVTITVLDQANALVDGVTVTGSWSPAGGTSNGNCAAVTSAGQCTHTTADTAFDRGTNETWTVGTLSKATYTYDSTANVVSSKAITSP